MWPFGVALWGEMPNRLMLRWLKTVVVSDEEKAPEKASGGDREDERKRIALARLPDPHLTPLNGRLFLIAHHDGLQPTQHEVV